MYRSRPLLACLLATAASPLFAQGDMPPATGRGGRGNAREFLCLEPRRTPRPLRAANPATGKPLCHLRLNSMVSNGPSTFLLDGGHYLIVGAGDTLWAFKLARK